MISAFGIKVMKCLDMLEQSITQGKGVGKSVCQSLNV
jgi:hypothetical protein